MKGNRLFKSFLFVSVFSWIGLFALAPNIMLLGASFARHDGGHYLLPGFTLQNFVLLVNHPLWIMFRQSFVYALATMLICLVVAYPFAYISVRRGKRVGKGLLLLIMIPFWTNSLVRTYALAAVLKADGPLNQALMWLGVIDAPLKIMYTPLAVYLGLVYMLLPFMILPLYAAIERMDRRLLEAARDLGANGFKRFTRITLPLTMPGIVTGCIMVFLPAMGMFYVSDLLGGAKHMLLGNYIRDQFLVARNWPMGAAASVAMTGSMIIMLLLYYRSVRYAGARRAA